MPIAAIAICAIHGEGTTKFIHVLFIWLSSWAVQGGLQVHSDSFSSTAADIAFNLDNNVHTNLKAKLANA